MVVGKMDTINSDKKTCFYILNFIGDLKNPFYQPI